MKLTKELAQKMYASGELLFKQFAIENYPELAEKQLPKRWKDIGEISGFFVDGNSYVKKSYKCHTEDANNQNIFTTIDQAEVGGKILSKLSQAMKVYRGDWLPDWENSSEIKCCIEINENEINIIGSYNIYYFLSFPDPKTAQLFQDNFKGEILQLKKF